MPAVLFFWLLFAPWLVPADYNGDGSLTLWDICYYQETVIENPPVAPAPGTRVD